MEKNTCKRCGYTWQPRVETGKLPRQCPYCKSPKWTLPKGGKPEEKKEEVEK